MPAMNLIAITETITDGNCGSGFSREEGWFHSRLKPLPQ